MSNLTEKLLSKKREVRITLRTSSLSFICVVTIVTMTIMTVIHLDRIKLPQITEKSVKL